MVSGVGITTDAEREGGRQQRLNQRVGGSPQIKTSEEETRLSRKSRSCDICSFLAEAKNLENTIILSGKPAPSAWPTRRADGGRDSAVTPRNVRSYPT